MNYVSCRVLSACAGLAMVSLVMAAPDSSQGPTHVATFSDSTVFDGFQDGATHLSQVWVRFKAGTTVEAMTESMKRVGSDRVAWQSQLVPGLMAIEVPAGTVGVAVAALNQDAAVSYAEVVYYRHVMVQETPYGIPSVGAPTVWPQGKGSGAVVAVLDTGVDFGHPDLPAVFLSESFIPGELVDDLHSHGTHVSGTVLALDNDFGVVGVAPEASLMIGKVLSNGGSGSDVGVNAGIEWAALNGADVISMSLGGGGASQAGSDVCQAATDAGAVVVAAAGNANSDVPSYPGSYESVLCVAAIDSNLNRASFSNFGTTVDISGPGVGVLSTIPIVAGSATWDGTPREGRALAGSANGVVTGQAIYCGFGGNAADFPSSVSGQIAHCRRGNAVTFATRTQNAMNAGAIGVIVSNNNGGLFNGTLNGSFAVPVLGISQTDGDALQASSGVVTTITIGITGHGYAAYSGTSMSTPHVAGVAGLVIGNMLPRRFTAVEVRTALESTAQDLGDLGRDNLFGYGNVQAPGALAYLQSLPGDCASDWDNDGDSDSDDIIAFFTGWDTGEGDVDGDGDSDSDDVITFFGAFEAGC